MNKFAVRICPLCSKKLLKGDEDSRWTFFCSEFFLRRFTGSFADLFLYGSDDAYHQGYLKEPHYSVDYSDGVWTQSTIIPPYWIRSNSNEQVSRIYKFDKTITAEDSNLLLEIPLILPSDYVPEQFARKIKNLVIFS